jgi:hypothetical protein
MIWLIGFVALFFFLIAEPTRLLLSDIPRTDRDFQTARTLNHLLDRMKADIEQSHGLETATGEPNCPPAFAAIQKNRKIWYLFEDGQVRRAIGEELNKTATDQAQVWPLPYARFVWDIRGGNAVEISGWIERTVLGKNEKKFANSHIFYVKKFEPGATE